MSTLRRQEPLGLGLKRIACAQVEAAIRSLTRQAGQGAIAADAMRQAEAVLTLIEPDLPRPLARRDRAIVARLTLGLGELTDPQLMSKQLESQYKKSPSDDALASAVKALRKRWAAYDPDASALSSKAGTFNPAIYRLVADMAELRGHVGDWPADAIPEDTPPRGLRRTYTKARKLANEPITPDTLDGLAQAITRLAHQLSVISKACPPMVKAQRKLITRTADALTALLIDEALDNALRQELGKAADKALPDREPITQRAAEALGSDLAVALAETPAAFMNRMQVYWSAWRSA